MQIRFKKNLFFGIVYMLFVHVPAAQQVQQWNRFEIELKHIYAGNAFRDIQLSAKFIHKDTSYVVDGFFDGNDVFKIRFMPEKTGAWNYITSSNVKALNNQKGSFEWWSIAVDYRGEF